MKCTSDWQRNRISPRVKMETIKKKLSLTNNPVYFDDVKDDKFMVKMTEAYDDGETYETSEVIYEFLLQINLLNVTGGMGAFDYFWKLKPGQDLFYRLTTSILQYCVSLVLFMYLVCGVLVIIRFPPLKFCCG